MNSLRTIAPIAYTQEIRKMPFAVSSRRVLRYSVNNTTLANSANVDSPDRILLFEEITSKKSRREYVG